MKKNIFLWSLYDFANSILMIVFLFYFSQWLVVDSGKPDWWYNLTLIFSSVIFIVIAPILARRVDVGGNKLSGLRVTTGLFFVLYLSTALVILFAPSQALLAAILFTFSMAVYLLSFIYYTPMINDISHEGNRAWISGLGQGSNYVGQVFGLLVTLPFATGAIYLFGSPGRPQTLLPALILFVISALPLLVYYLEPIRTRAAGIVSVKDEYGKILSTAKKVFSIKNLALLIVGYFLFSDALLTFSNNFPIFLEKVFGVGDNIKIYLSASILVLSVIGSVVVGKIADKKGTKRTLTVLLGIWVVLFPLLAFAPSFKFAIGVMVVAGFFFGPVWGVSRAMVSQFTPREIEGSAFGFYILAERFATFIGPIVWSIVLASTASRGSSSYSYAILGMGVLILISLLFIRKIRPVVQLPDDTPQTDSSRTS